MISWIDNALKKLENFIKKNKRYISIACVSIFLIIMIYGECKNNTYLLIISGLMVLIGMIIESGIINMALYLILGVLLIAIGYYQKKSILVNLFIGLLFIIWGISCIFLSNKYIKKAVNEDGRKQENSFLVWLLLFIGGTLLTIASVLFSIKDMISLFSKWVPHEEILTGVSILVTLITFSIGQFFKIQSDKISRKQEKQIALHKEMDWRRELWNLEVQPEYNIQDLIKLNSFFNPKHSTENEEDIDVRLNTAVVNILSKYTCRNSVYFNKSENNKKENEPLVTLFDYSLTEDVIDQKLNPEENQEIRELIHELLKVDWDKQTKY